MTLIPDSQATGVFLWSFFNELALWGVRDVVVSFPGFPLHRLGHDRIRILARDTPIACG